MAFDKPIESDRSTGRTAQLLFRAIRLHIKARSELGSPSRNIWVVYLAPQACEFFHLQNLNVASEIGALLRQVGIDVEHTPVVIAYDPESVVLHHMGNTSRFNPFTDLGPGSRIVFKRTRHLKEGNPAAIEHIGDFRNGAGLTVCEPLARHAGAIAKLVELFVVNGSGRG